MSLRTALVRYQESNKGMKQVTEKDTGQAVDRQVGLEPATPLLTDPVQREAPASPPTGLLLITTDNGTACTAEGCAVSFNKKEV